MNNEKVKFLLNWNHFAEHLSSCMTKLMTDSSFSDIIISTADKHMIYSHRFVLANSSKYFQRLLKHVSKQGGSQLVVALPEIKYDIFKILMNYMYKGETQVPHELLPSVIKAGQFLEINGLVNLSENESSNNSESSKTTPPEDSQSRCIIIHTSNTSGNENNSKGRISATLRDKLLSKENRNNSSKNVVPMETRRTRRQNASDYQNPEKSGPESSGKENDGKVKSSRSKNLTSETKDVIQLPVKRKTSGKESDKKTLPAQSSTTALPATPSLSSESGPPKKLQKKSPVPQEVVKVKVKHEKENNPLQENEIEEVDVNVEKITIKVEAPDEIEEDVYNELQCEFCQDVYSKPSDWVRHMSDQHSDRGYQAYKDADKNVANNAIITCVVCSSVCISAAEWAKHLRTWHTDKELAAANLGETKKGNKNKKNQSLSKKDSR